MTVQQTLAQVGLDQHEIAVYLALVQLQNATAGQISKISHVPRTYAYKVLESLIEKGFVTAMASGSIRRYKITDFDAPKRYLERQQLDLYNAQQQLQVLGSQLQNLSQPQVPLALAESLKDAEGMRDFWQLLHSTITREIWVIHPPAWWGEASHSTEVKKWEQYRNKQHIWEKRFMSGSKPLQDIPFTEVHQLTSPPTLISSLFLIDQYQVQVTSWEPFRAIRIESQEMVELMKAIFVRG